MSVAALAVLASAALSGCAFSLGDDDEAPEARAGAGAAPVDAEAEPAAKSGKQSLKVDKSVWYGGLKLTFGEVTYDPAARQPLLAKVLVDNLSGRDWRPSLPIIFSVDGQQYEGDFVQSTLVGGKQQSRLELAFRVEQLPGGLAAGQFLVGRGSEVQSVLPLGTAKLVANEPKQVLGPKKTTVRDLTISWKTCELRGDFVPQHDQAQREHTVLACWLDLQADRHSHYVGEQHFRLKLPDGTVVGPTRAPNEATGQNKVEADCYLAFQIKWPAAGSYTLQVVDSEHGGDKTTPENIGEVPLTL